jgi:hypothetical protein
MKQVTPDVWQVASPPIRMPGGVCMPLAATVLRLADRSLLVYSPIAFTPEQAAAIDALGEVKHIVGPSLYHHLHLRAASERWPAATLLGAPGLAAKRAGLAFHGELASGVDIDPAIDVEVVGGVPRINEVLLLHRPSGALVCADFLFHIAEPANWRTRFVLALMGVGRELEQSRMWKMLGRDRAATRASIDRVLGWPIATIVPAHGEPVTTSTANLAPKLARAYGGQVPTALPRVGGALSA